MVDYYKIKKAIADLFMIQKDDEFYAGDLIINFGKLHVEISDEEIRRAYEDAAKIKGNKFFSSTSCYAEVAVQLDGRFSRNEEIEVEDNDNGVTYQLGPASIEYSIYVINMICESEEIDYNRTIQDFRLAFNIASRRAIIEKNSEFKRILSQTLRLTSLKMRFKNETNIEQIKRYASAFEYFFMYKRGYALFEVSNINTLLRIEGGGRSRVSKLEEAPKRSVNPEILEFYSMALASGKDPFTMYISFYHIIEYFFDEVYQKKLLDDMREKITSPDFSYKNDKKLLDLASFINKRMKSDNDAGKGNEFESLKYVLTTYVPIEELKEKLDEINPTIIQFYSEKSVSFTGNQKLKIAWNDQNGIYNLLAKRIYTTRNALVHSKSGQKDKVYKPLKHKEALYKEMPLIQVVAEMVIVKSGEVL